MIRFMSVLFPMAALFNVTPADSAVLETNMSSEVYLSRIHAGGASKDWISLQTIEQEARHNLRASSPLEYAKVVDEVLRADSGRDTSEEHIGRRQVLRTETIEVLKSSLSNIPANPTEAEFKSRELQFMLALGTQEFMESKARTATRDNSQIRDAVNEPVKELLLAWSEIKGIVERVPSDLVAKEPRLPAGAEKFINSMRISGNIMPSQISNPEMRSQYEASILDFAKTNTLIRLRMDASTLERSARNKIHEIFERVLGPISQDEKMAYIRSFSQSSVLTERRIDSFLSDDEANPTVGGKNIAQLGYTVASLPIPKSLVENNNTAISIPQSPSGVTVQESLRVEDASGIEEQRAEFIDLRIGYTLLPNAYQSRNFDTPQGAFNLIKETLKLPNPAPTCIVYENKFFFPTGGADKIGGFSSGYFVQKNDGKVFRFYELDGQKR